MNFLIQTKDNKIVHDFSFTLLQAIDYQNEFQKWQNNVNEHRVVFINSVLENQNSEIHVPIGSVEFVINYLEKHFTLTPKPKNVPEELFDRYFTGRKIFNGTEKDIIGKKFVKSNDIIKFKNDNGEDFTGIYGKEDKIPIGNYQISSVIQITSEWRAFVYDKKLVGLKNYLGDFDVFPNVKKIKEMIDKYISQPIAYTLDVGIIEDNGDTVVIEVHDFFSCGLYGFSDYNILPNMFSKWFFEFLKNNNKMIFSN